MRQLFIANWKTYLDDAEAVELARAYAQGAASSSLDVAVAPGFTALERVARALEGSGAALGAQDLSSENGGAQTGEVTPLQLKALGVRYVIVGHSERRARGETDEEVGRKASAAASAGMVPIVCVGELAEERASGRRDEVVQAQLQAALTALPAEAPVVIAYEPRWAIGTGTPCAAADVASMHAVIRAAVGPGRLILYGGSVDPHNALPYLAVPEVGGLLVGGASARAADVRAFFEAFSS